MVIYIKTLRKMSKWRDNKIHERLLVHCKKLSDKSNEQKDIWLFMTNLGTSNANETLEFPQTFCIMSCLLHALPRCHALL